MRTGLLTPALALIFGTACHAQPPAQPENNVASHSIDDGSFTPSRSIPFNTATITSLDEPWAMTFIPGGPWALVTERKGKLILLDTRDNKKYEVSGVPNVSYGGQGGFGDVVAAPDPDPTDKIHPIYLSWAEAGPAGTHGAVVATANITINSMASQIGSLKDVRIIWRQSEKVTGQGHFAHRIAIAPDKKHIFISSGERQKFDPAQDMNSNLGKIVRLNLDGSIPTDNPYATKGGVTAQIWSLGQRNPLSIAFDRDGRLWESEMGPKGGDEINLIIPKGNYGYPKVSNGDHYDGKPIPNHAPGDGFLPPKAYWNPSISPGGMAYYDGHIFPQWRNSLLLAALSGRALIRLEIEGENLRKADHWDMGARIREVEVAADGSVWLLEDGANAKLLKLTPKPQN